MILSLVVYHQYTVLMHAWWIETPAVDDCIVWKVVSGPCRIQGRWRHKCACTCTVLVSQDFRCTRVEDTPCTYTVHVYVQFFERLICSVGNYPFLIHTDSMHMWPAGHSTSQTLWAQLNIKTKEKSEWTWKEYRNKEQMKEHKKTTLVRNHGRKEPQEDCLISLVCCSFSHGSHVG